MRNEHFLIVDDDNTTLKTIDRALTVRGFKTTLANDGREALDIIENNTSDDEAVDIVITDIQMPEIDGLVLLAHVHENYSAMPCFVMTAYDTPDIKKRLPKDLLRFFKKPFDIKKMANAIISILEQNIPSGAIY